MASLEEIASRFPKAIEELQRSNERAAKTATGKPEARELTDLRKEVTRIPQIKGPENIKTM